MSRIAIAAAVAAAVCLAAPPARVAAQSTAAKPPQGQSMQSADKDKMKAGGSPDEEFITKAAADGTAEVELGKLASSKASDAKVKMLAQRLVKDHSTANTQLMTLAKTSHVTVQPASADSKRTLTHSAR
jgi:predicted outer membrane protein